MSINISSNSPINISNIDRTQFFNSSSDIAYSNYIIKINEQFAGNFTDVNPLINIVSNWQLILYLLILIILGLFVIRYIKNKL